MSTASYYGSSGPGATTFGGTPSSGTPSAGSRSSSGGGSVSYYGGSGPGATTYGGTPSAGTPSAGSTSSGSQDYGSYDTGSHSGPSSPTPTPGVTGYYGSTGPGATTYGGTPSVSIAAVNTPSAGGLMSVAGVSGYYASSGPSATTYGAPVGKGLLSSVPATDPIQAYQQAATGMNLAGIGNLAGKASGTFATDVMSVVDAGRGWTTVQLRDGSIERRDGTRNQRNHNPGNLEFGRTARSFGAVGSDGRFAVFPTREQGLWAMEQLVFGPAYRGRTIEGAINRYAPPFENNTSRYVSIAANAAGVPKSTIVGDLTPDQRRSMIDAMVRHEGATPYEVTSISGPTVGTATQPAPAVTQQAPSATVASVSETTAPSPEQPGLWTNPFPENLDLEDRPMPDGTIPSAMLASVDQASPLENEEEDDKPRVGEKIAETAIDIGVGLLPGVGPAAGLFNAGAALTGKRTIGARVVDLLGNTSGGSGVGPNSIEPGGGDENYIWSRRLAGMPETETAPEVDASDDSDSTFADRYLTGTRPTPTQKWGVRGIAA